MPRHIIMTPNRMFIMKKLVDDIKDDVKSLEKQLEILRTEKLEEPKVSQEREFELKALNNMTGKDIYDNLPSEKSKKAYSKLMGWDK